MSSNGKFRNYLLMTMLGYFGIKIVNGASKALPAKDSSNEMYDFTTATLMGGILYFLNNMGKRELMGADQTGTWLYYFGFAVGLTMPFVRHNVFGKMKEDTWDKLKYFLYTMVLAIVLSTFYITWSSKQEDIVGSTTYMLYILAILLLMMGIIFTKREPRKYPTTDRESGQKGVYESAGQYTTLGLGISAWLISLLFVADSQDGTLNSFLAFMQGIFYGIFVGSLSLFGAKYILSDTVEHRCVGDQCKIEGMIIDDKPYNSLTSEISTLRWVLGLTIVVLMVMITLFYTSAAEFLPFGN